MTVLTSKPLSTDEPLMALSLLNEQLLNYRNAFTGERIAASLPELFVAMAQDAVRDFPALRPHQRHPWHAFLVQLAAIALHNAERSEPFTTANEWRDALLALTPNDPDGVAWCLVSPLSRPAFMQAPEPSGCIDDWKNTIKAADELDMLVTSKNHDLKASRMQRSTSEEWIYSLISLQTQEGFLGSGNYGISRMNGGFANRCGVGIHPNGLLGRRWLRDIKALQASRQTVADDFDLKASDPIALVWLQPWDGSDSLSFCQLDPWYIEICRRIRFTNNGALKANASGSKVARISAKDLNGRTGDAWMPLDSLAGKALTIGARGFDYKLGTELLLGQKYTKPAAQMLLPTDDADGLYLIAQGVARGQGKTEGYHERRIPISRKVRQGLATRHTDELAKLATERIDTIAEIRKMLWTALTGFFGNGAKDETGKDKEASDTAKDRANRFAQPFEAQCDAMFFLELIEEIEAETGSREAKRTLWLLTLAERAEKVLRNAFVAGPRSSHLRYRAQATALARLRGAMYGNPSYPAKLPALAAALKLNQTQFTKETHESV